MTAVRIFKETAVPSTLEPNAIYLVGPANDPATLEVYVVNSAGDAYRKTPGTTEIQALIDASVAGISGTEIVADITERNELALTANAMVLVEDASADPTVDTGAALYTYKHSSTSFNKIAEYESLDVVLSWSAITGKPTSTPAAIDAAVGNSHTHTNASELDKVGEDGSGDPTYDGTNLVLVDAQNW